MKKIVRQGVIEKQIKKLSMQRLGDLQLYGNDGGGEIRFWLDKHPKVTRYVIIDDMDDKLEEQLHRFVKAELVVIALSQ